MRESRGITMVALVVTVLVISILAGIVTYNGINLYKNSVFETNKAKLTEVQKAVEKICVKYKNGDFQSYTDPTNGYFIKNYQTIPLKIWEEPVLEKSKEVVYIYMGNDTKYHDGYVFYFPQNEIKKYFNLEGIDFDVIVDFATRYVYSAKGFVNPEENKLLYTLNDVHEIKFVNGNNNSATVGINIEKSEPLKIGKKKYRKVTLSLVYDLTKGTKYDIKDAFYSRDDGINWSKVEEFPECKYEEGKVSFYIENPGRYFFYINDYAGLSINKLEDFNTPAFVDIDFKK